MDNKKITDLPVQKLGEEAPPAKDVQVVVDESGPVNKRGRVILSVLIIILIILLLLACAFLTNLLGDKGDKGGDTGGITWIRSIYGYGSNYSELISPASCTADPGGKFFWVADQSRFRLVQFDWNGKLGEVWDKDADGQAFDFPSDIAYSRDGWMYVAQSSYNNVKVYDQNKKLQQTLEVPRPMSVTVNEDMAVIGAESGFVAFDRQGAGIGTIGDGKGTGDNNFDTINGVVLDKDSNVYVVDSYNNRLSKYDKEGDRVWMVGLGAPGNGGADQRSLDEDEIKEKYPAMMQLPMGVTLDAAGRVVIIDCLDFSIAAFNPEDGKFLGKWGQFGSKDGQLAYPSDISYDQRRDWFVLTDSGNFRAQIVKIPGSGGNLLSSINAALTGPLGACCIPLLLIILFVILYTIWRWLKRRREKNELQRERDQALQAGEDLRDELKEDSPYGVPAEVSPPKITPLDDK